MGFILRRFSVGKTNNMIGRRKNRQREKQEAISERHESDNSFGSRVDGMKKEVRWGIPHSESEESHVAVLERSSS